MKEVGIVVRGELAHHDTKVISLDADAKTSKAWLSDGIDIPKWQTHCIRRTGPPDAHQPAAALHRDSQG
ncbi:hypothetical protein ACF052_33290 [Streptomyces pilosus]|uniref:hypothetical protein n=1 Tax=Streptomyces pilosus TaxID=28893 RepID=UPI0036F676D1